MFTFLLEQGFFCVYEDSYMNICESFCILTHINSPIGDLLIKTKFVIDNLFDQTHFFTNSP